MVVFLLPFSLQKSHVSMYADDTAISLSSKSIGDLQNDLNFSFEDFFTEYNGSFFLNLSKIKFSKKD